ncbi:MAG: hypothetical protein QM639_14905 [Rhodocyclaceae bacterium]|jgi:hypothetical protein
MKIKPYAMACILAVSAAPFAANAATAHEKQERDRIENTYKSARQQCDSLSGNGKDVCQEEAKAQRKIALADLDASVKGTTGARYDAQVARAEAEYAVAKERCDDKAGQAKDECVQAAKTTEEKAKADAKAAHKTADARRDESRTAARADERASEDKRKAERDLAAEKCDRLAGNAKSQCMNDVKAHFGS